MTAASQLRVALLIAAVTGALSPSRAVWGQPAWEYTPYDVRIRLAIDAPPDLAQSVRITLPDMLMWRAATIHSAVWRTSVSAASPGLRGAMQTGLGDLTAERIVAAAADDLAADKLFLTTCRSRNGHWSVGVREFDCRTRQLGPVIERATSAVETLGGAVWDAVQDGFTPIARIETVDETRAMARLRAGGLIAEGESSRWVEPGMVLMPVLRRNERGGQPAKGGIQVVPWTALTVMERRDSLVECALYSGYRSAIPAKPSSRLERLALLVKPRWPATRLVLVARDNPDKALCAYEVHGRPAAEDGQPVLLGTTDFEGAITLPRGDGSLQLLFVRNGKQLLARLPIVPGQAESMIAKLPDDDLRLEAEGFVAALTSRAVDLVARREIFAARIRARLKAGKADEAQQLLDEFRKLQTRAELTRDLDQFRQRASGADKLTRTRIDLVLADAQKLLLLKALSDDLLTQLTREVTAAGATAK